jgi:hypothetical protein
MERELLRGELRREDQLKLLWNERVVVFSEIVDRASHHVARRSLQPQTKAKSGKPSIQLQTSIEVPAMAALIAGYIRLFQRSDLEHADETIGVDFEQLVFHAWEVVRSHIPTTTHRRHSTFPARAGRGRKMVAMDLPSLLLRSSLCAFRRGQTRWVRGLLGLVLERCLWRPMMLAQGNGRSTRSGGRPLRASSSGGVPQASPRSVGSACLRAFGVIRLIALHISCTLQRV